MALDPATEPPESLVQWAANHPVKCRVVQPWDRPWYWLPDEIRKTPQGYWCLCRCRRQETLVKLTRHKSQPPQRLLYIGQCGTCGAVVWTYRER